MRIKDKITLEDKRRKTYEFFVNKGLSPSQAAALTGNFAVESNFNTRIEGDKNLSSNSVGLAQWREDRLDRLKSMYDDPYSLDNQLEYVWWELNNTHRHALKALQQAQTPEEAAIAVRAKYEVAWDKHDDRRIQNTLDVLTKYGGNLPMEQTPRQVVMDTVQIPEKKIDNTQVTQKVINFPKQTNFPTFTGPKETKTAEKKETPTEVAKNTLEQKKSEQQFIKDILSGKAKPQKKEPQQQVSEQPIQPYGSFILDKAKELGIFQEGGTTSIFVQDTPAFKYLKEDSEQHKKTKIKDLIQNLKLPTKSQSNQYQLEKDNTAVKKPKLRDLNIPVPKKTKESVDIEGILAEASIDLVNIKEEDFKNLNDRQKRALQKKLIEEGALREKIETPKTKEDIKKVQQYLISKGYDLGKYGADGVIGTMTRNALKEYNKDASSIDGIIGAKTKKALTEYQSIMQKIGPISRSLKKEASWVGRQLNRVPLSVRQFVYDTFGGEGDITEADLNEGEYEALKKAVNYSLKNNVKKKNNFVINYDVWRATGAGGKDVRQDDMNLLNPSSSLQKTLGQARIDINEDGDIYVIDTYNFNDADGKRNSNSLTNKKGLLPLSEATFDQ